MAFKIDALRESASTASRRRRADVNRATNGYPKMSFTLSKMPLSACSDVGAAPLADTEGGVLPSGPQESWQSRVGPGDAGALNSYIEPPEG